jgi:hypothetical protein
MKLDDQRLIRISKATRDLIQGWREGVSLHKETGEEIDTLCLRVTKSEQPFRATTTPCTTPSERRPTFLIVATIMRSTGFSPSSSRRIFHHEAIGQTS